MTGKESEEELKGLKNKYERIIKHLDIGYFKADANGIILDHNPSFSRIFGFESNESLVGLSAIDLWGNPEDFNKYLKEITEKGKLRSYIHKARKKNGETIILHTHSHVYKNKEKNRFEAEGTIFDITEKYVLEQKLKESEEKYRNLFERAPFSIWLIDFDGTIIDCNMASNSLISKIDVKNLIGKNLTDLSVLVKKFKKSLGFSKELVSESIVSRLRVRMQNVIKGEVQEPIEFQYHRFDGKSLWVNLQSSLVKIGDKELIQVIIQDITERKNMEQELKESEEKYRLISENANDMIVVLNEKFEYEYLNEQVHKKIMGYSKEDIIGKSALEFIHPDDIKTTAKTLKIGFETGEESAEVRVKSKKGDYLLLEVRGKTFIDKDGKKKGLLISRDITERKAAELLIKESEEKYRLISENANDLICILDNVGKFLYCNETFKKIVGYSPKELLGTNAVKLVHPDDINQISRDFEYTLTRGSGMNISRFRCKDGTYKWIESKGTITYDEENKPAKNFIVARDFTERKRMEEKLKKSEEELKILNKELEQKVKERTRELEEKNLELKKLDKAKDDFITMAAHELKTPLISVAGYTEFILMKYDDSLSSDVKGDLEIVQRNINRLQTLMNQLLDVMKLESHKMELDIKRTNVSNIIYRCLNELNYLFKEKNHEVILNLDNEIFLLIDSLRIFQVFSNLISNATKFTPKRGKIEISAKKSENQYFFEVKDNGIGLSEGDLERIFKKFETVKQNRNDIPTGSGLGLSISMGFVEAHGGKMWATSEGLNKGMTIHFTIPI